MKAREREERISCLWALSTIRWFKVSHSQLKYKKTPRTDLILILDRFQQLPPNLHLGVWVPGCADFGFLAKTFLFSFFLESGPFSSGFLPPSPLLSPLRSIMVFRIEIPTEKYLVSPLWTYMAFNEQCFETIQCWQPSIGRPSFSKEWHQWASNYRDIWWQKRTFNIAYDPKSTSRKISWELQNTMQAAQEGEAKVLGEMDHLETKKKQKTNTAKCVLPLCRAPPRVLYTYYLITYFKIHVF